MAEIYIFQGPRKLNPVANDRIAIGDSADLDVDGEPKRKYSLVGDLQGIVITRLTRAEAQELIAAEEIAIGSKYLIEDATGEDIDLILEGDSTTGFATLAFSSTAPGEVIRYDFTTDTIIGRSSIDDFIAQSVKDEEDNISQSVSNLGVTAISTLSPSTVEQISYLQNKVAGKKVNILGDSISTSDGGATPGVNPLYTYVGLLNNLLNCTLYVNAVADSCIIDGGSGAVDFTNNTRWVTMNTNIPDVILIFGGINDWIQDLTLGTLGDADKTASFYGALDFLYKSILNANPNARVFHVTPLHTTFAAAGGLIPENNGTNFLTDFIQAIREVSDRYGVGIIDTNKNSGITCYNIDALSDDGIHPQEIGHRMIFNTIVNELNRLL